MGVVWMDLAGEALGEEDMAVVLQAEVLRAEALAVGCI
jgi:hypothetical protein